MNVSEYLALCDRVNEEGTFHPDWESLSAYPVPSWYQDAKFGIFIHWGVYSVPAFGNEWYPREMYQQGSEIFRHHQQTYGSQKEFGYKEFIPMFQAERFDPAQWAELFEEAGAKYVMPVAEHHDGFQMYDSELSRWNAVKMGPCRNILGELREELTKRGMEFCLSSHRAEHAFFMDGGLEFDSDVTDPAFSDYFQPLIHKPDDHEDIYAGGVPKEHLENWLARCCELVDRYRPSVFWFDWWIQQLDFKPYLKRFMAYYYNRSLEWGKTVAVNYKYDACAYGTAVYDIERGQLSGISPRLWQNDTAIAKNSWGYTENNEFKSARSILCDLIDVTSKNGCLLLNVGPRSDGTITEEETRILKEIGGWLKVNGEGIYGSRFWRTYGEGPTEVPEGAFTDTNRGDFTSEDIRYTSKDGAIFAYVLRYPEDGRIHLKSLADNKALFHGAVEGVSLLGCQETVEWKQTPEGVFVTLPCNELSREFPIGLKIRLR